MSEWRLMLPGSEWRSESPECFVPPCGAEPLFETTTSETLGIRKFLEMSMADLRDQVTRASKDRKVHPKQFKQIKAHAMILTTWMVSALQMVDGMLAETKAVEPTETQKQ